MAKIDPVLALHARIEAVHDAIEAEPARAAKLTVRLEALWRKREHALPNSLEGAAELLSVADDYLGDLQDHTDWCHFDPGSYVPRLATQVRSGDVSARDVAELQIVARMVRRILPAGHAASRMLQNVADFLSKRAGPVAIAA